MIAAKRVLVAGATGAIGRVLCRLLVSDGWQVVGTTRRAEAAPALMAMGVAPAIVDVLDADALHAVVLAARPSAVIHQLTDLPKQFEHDALREALPRNARLREVGTRHLVDACVDAGVGHVIVQSIAFAYAPGPIPQSEDAPLNIDAADKMAAQTARAVHVMERLVLSGPFRGVVLRYGRLYGPGTWTDVPPSAAPVHVDAAAEAARLALTRGEAGVYNVAEPDGTVSITRTVTQLGWDPSFRMPAD
ncbi:MAG: NAD(P)-dependent oxidoreductase [Gemmatimonadaceae bacterium]|nr:NAD(P)-dependent oxidoreductase [Gemmatimonadaceae bacterium]